MEKILIRSAAWFVLLTGIGHTGTHVLMNLRGNADPVLKKAMEMHKIPFITERSLFDYHQGFSLTMGVLLIGFGLNIFQLAESVKQRAYLNSTLLAGIVSLIAVVYFHPVAIAGMGLSFLCLMTAKILNK